MRNSILIFLFININIAAYNQVIKGTILENKTNNPVIAAIYFNGTFIGTQSDQNGNFELNISTNVSMPLTISSVGYYSVTLTDFSADKPLLIYMTPRAYEVKEVVISSKSLARRRKANLNLFKNIFLGTTVNARNCEISNEKDITFNYGSDRDTLKAFASKPILINNRALGYKITYYLDRFEYYKRDRSFVYQGNPVFNEDFAAGGKLKKVLEGRRKDAYLGSRMHFFRALWADELKSEGFEVRNEAYEQLNYNNIIEESPPDSLNNHTKFLKYSKKLTIIYNKGLSKIELLKEKVYFDKEGYFDQSGMSISWEGEMMIQRVGDMLPYTYKIEE